ncbi:MAG: M23 family metallopeptidase [Lachnospiraceae bacterium]|nr:M23 family metallopeptidase [Lachnospiraceae bacterium]
MSSAVASADQAAANQAAADQDAADQPVSATQAATLHFQEKTGLEWPIVGNVLINYSMDKPVYFATLEQYKYNPAIVIQATEGAKIQAAADGQVTEVGSSSALGNYVCCDLGDGYELTYGQLKQIDVKKGAYLHAGDVIGQVAAPSKYYSTEGTNAYFAMTKDGEPVNPLTLLP